MGAHRQCRRLTELQLGAVHVSTLTPPISTPPPRLVAHWQILAPAQSDPSEQYTLRAEVSQPGAIALPLTIVTTLDQVTGVAHPRQAAADQAMALFNRIARIQGTQQYFIFLRIVHPVQVVVTLTDPQGRFVTQTGAL